MGSLPGKGKVDTSVGAFIVDEKHPIGSSNAEEECPLGVERRVQKSRKPALHSDLLYRSRCCRG